MKTLTASLGSMFLALALPVGAQADEVFEAKLSLSAVAQGGTMGAPLIEKVKVSGDTLLNVARGRSPDAVVPDNEVLVVIVDCDTWESRLSVFDTTGGTELVTLADSGDVEVVLGATSGVVVADMDVNDVGNTQNGLDGGSMVVAGTFKFGAGDCPAGLKASLSGVIEVTITDEVGTESFPVLVQKGKLSTGKASIDTLP